MIIAWALDCPLWRQDVRRQRRSHWRILTLSGGTVGSKIVAPRVETKVSHVRIHAILGRPSLARVGTSITRGWRSLHSSLGRRSSCEALLLFVRDGRRCSYFPRVEGRRGIGLEWRITAKGLDRVDGIAQDLGGLFSGHLVTNVLPRPVASLLEESVPEEKEAACWMDVFDEIVLRTKTLSFYIIHSISLTFLEDSVVGQCSQALWRSPTFPSWWRVCSPGSGLGQ